MPEVISRKAARRAELLHFFTGVPCLHGHLELRMTSSGGCMACCRDRANRRHAANSELLNAKLREWRQENPKQYQARLDLERIRKAEKRRARDDARRQNTPIIKRREARAEGLEWYWTGKPCPHGHIAERRVTDSGCRTCEPIRALKWCHANPDKQRATWSNRRARIRKAVGSHTAEDVARIRKAQKGRCAYCPAKLKDGEHKDHIVPIQLGGTNFASNIQLTCPKHNLKKSYKDPVAFAQELGRLL